MRRSLIVYYFYEFCRRWLCYSYLRKSMRRHPDLCRFGWRVQSDVMLLGGNARILPIRWGSYWICVRLFSIEKVTFILINLWSGVLQKFVKVAESPQNRQLTLFDLNMRLHFSPYLNQTFNRAFPGNGPEFSAVATGGPGGVLPLTTACASHFGLLKHTFRSIT